MALKREPHLQKIADDRYIVRLGTQRMGEVIQSEQKWYYVKGFVKSKEGYDTREQAIEEIMQTTTKRKKKPADYPRIDFRLSQERIDWFRGYSKRVGKSMSTIIKEYIEQLYQHYTLRGKKQ